MTVCKGIRGYSFKRSIRIYIDLQKSRALIECFISDKLYTIRYRNRLKRRTTIEGIASNGRKLFGQCYGFEGCTICECIISDFRDGARNSYALKRLAIIEYVLGNHLASIGNNNIYAELSTTVKGI